MLPTGSFFCNPRRSPGTAIIRPEGERPVEARGYTHVYTGNGKGKTTAALGLVLRASGAGLSVFLGQFLKRAKESEHVALALLGPKITVRTFGACRRVGAPVSDEDASCARAGFRILADSLAGGAHDLVVADEILVAAHLGLLSEDDVLSLLDVRPANVELVLTGRNAFPELLRRADLVTEMREVRHYFRSGVAARPGIER
jgi:cob(I)alamin adenosyltransferase